MAGTTPATCPGRPAGAGEHRLCPMLPATRPAPWPWTSAHVGPLRPRRRRNQAAGQAAALGYVNPRASQARPAPHHPFLSRPDAAGAHAARGPRGQIDPLRPAGAAHHTEPLQAQRADSPAAAPRTPEPVRPDTWMPRTPGHRTPGHRTPGRWTSARPVGRTSPRRDRTRRTGNDRPGRRPDISRPATPARRPDLARSHGAWGARPPTKAPRRRHLRRGPDRCRHWTAAQHHPA
jgi:hypothetical protein